MSRWWTIYSSILLWATWHFENLCQQNVISSVLIFQQHCTMYIHIAEYILLVASRSTLTRAEYQYIRRATFERTDGLSNRLLWLAYDYAWFKTTWRNSMINQRTASYVIKGHCYTFERHTFCNISRPRWTSSKFVAFPNWINTIELLNSKEHGNGIKFPLRNKWSKILD